MQQCNLNHNISLFQFQWEYIFWG